MANNIDPTQFESYDDYRAYMEYVSQAQGHNSAIQKAGPQAFQPADNQVKVEGALQDAQRQSAIGDKLAPAFGSFSKGMVQGATGGLVKPDPHGLPESHAAEVGGDVLGGSMALSGIGKLLGSGIPAAGSLASKVSPELTDLLGVISPRAGNALKLAQRLGTRAAPELESAGASGIPVKGAAEVPGSLAKVLEGGKPIDPSKINLDPTTGSIRPNVSKWDFPIRKRGLGVE